MSKVYVSIGENGYMPEFEMLTVETAAYPYGEMFAVFDEEVIATALWCGPHGNHIVLDNAILREAAKKLEEGI